MIMETHYYLLNGTVKKGGEMPKGYIDCEIDQFNWLSSLQPCEISESEFHRIINYLYPTDKKTHYPENPIDITDIVEEKRVIDNSYKGEETSWKNVIIFKQHKQVESDAPEFLKWVWLNKYTDNNDADELYEIFKNR